MKFNVDEISSVIRQEIENYRTEVDVSEVGPYGGTAIVDFDGLTAGQVSSLAWTWGTSHDAQSGGDVSQLLFFGTPDLGWKVDALANASVGSWLLFLDTGGTAPDLPSAFFLDGTECTVFGVPDEDWGEAVHAVVVPREAVTPEELIAFCREHIAGYKLPKAITLAAEELPKSGPGKILKRELREPFWEGHDKNVN